MCFGSPKPPKLPDPEPMDSAIEQTADKVVMADKRTQPSKKKKQQLATVTGRRRLGTKSLQIPLLANTSGTGNLNYPT